MTNGEAHRLREYLAAEVDRRMERIEKKIDLMYEKCAGCARQFGCLDTDVKNLHERMKDHVAEHRWRIGIAAAIGGSIVAAANFVIAWARGIK